jgi:NhaP-type Na+/H+ or K+/H+ antiporter
MLKLQPDTKPIKTKIAGESLFNRGFALVVFITSIKISSS